MTTEHLHISTYL